MKVMIAISLLFAAFATQAEVKPMGTFVPSLCSYTIKAGPVRAELLAVESVCVGKLSGMRQDVVKLVLNSGEVRTYAVKFKRGKGGMGVSKSPFTGLDESGTDKISGILNSTSGITTTYGISVKTKSNLEFRGPLKVVFTTL